MEFYVSNIEKDSLENDYFRKVLFTGKYSQLVVMSLLPKEEIGEEVHMDVDQFVRIEEGSGQFVLNSRVYEVSADFAVVVPAGTLHNVINTSEDKKMKLYTIYSPAEHADGTIHKTREEALSEEHH